MRALIVILLGVLCVAPAPVLAEGAPDDGSSSAPTGGGTTFTIGGTTYSVVPDAAVRARGLKLQPIAPQENAAFDYFRAIEAYWEPEGLTRDDELWRALGNWRWSGEAGPQVREYLEKNEETLKHIKAAAAKRACRFPYLIEQGKELDEDTQIGSLALPFLAKARTLARFLLVVGKVQEFEGHPARALDTYLLILRLGDDVAQEGPLIDGLVAIACNSMGTRAIERCLVANDLDDATLARTQKHVHDLWRRRPSLTVVLRVERPLAVEGTEYIIRNPQTFWKRMDEEPTADEKAWAEAVQTETGAEQFRRETRQFLDFMDEAASLPLPEYLEKQEELKARIEAKLSAVSKARWEGIWRLPVQFGRADLAWTVLDAVFALARYRAEHHEYPGSLDEVKDLMRSDGTDPFSGKPLRYRLELDGSFTLWSVGEDLKDDGGALGKSHNPWRGDDHVWNSALIAAEE